MGIVGRLVDYIQEFLYDVLTLQVKAGRPTSSPIVRSGVPKGSVLSPFLSNLVLVPFSDCIPTGLRRPVEVAVYADDVVL